MQVVLDFQDMQIFNVWWAKHSDLKFSQAVEQWKKERNESVKN